MSLLILARNRSTSVADLVLLISLITACDVVFFIGTEQYRMALFGALASLGLLLLPVVAFRNNLRLYAYLLLPVFILTLFNLSSVLLFDVSINDATLLLLINTNPQETFELLERYIPILTVYFLLYLGVLYLLFLRIPRTLSLKTSGALSLGALAILLFFPLVDGSTGPYPLRVSARLYTVFPTSLFYAGKTVYNQYRLINANKEERQKYTFQVRQDSLLPGKQVTVLLIGESARYDHWGINGYAKNTTPRLQKRDNLLSFNQVGSGGFITEFAVPLILTGVGADHFDAHFQQKGITGAFDEAGFKTFWITNQIDEGHIVLHVEEAGEVIMHQSDYKATKNIHRDMELLEVLARVLDEPGDKKFIVLHTLGSHYDYSARYPAEFDTFKPSNKTIFSKPTDKNFKHVLVNSYDNSILYTDTFIDSTISLVAAQNAVSSVTYISDHGENLFDDARNLSQHGYPTPSRYIAHIPFFIWYSPRLQNTFPEKITNLKAHINARISSESVIHTLTNLSGIYYPDQDQSRNIAGAGFRDSEQRILGADKKVYKVAELK